MSTLHPLFGTVTAEIRACARDTLACLRFYSRLPLAESWFERGGPGMLDFAHASRMLSVAGALIGCAGAAALLVAHRLGLPPLLAAVAAIAVQVRVTGGLHEDGLADTADGLGGGPDRAAKLAIMKDSRIGSYGAAALTLALFARAAALAALLDRLGPAGTAGAVVAAAAASRVAGLLPMALLPPARSNGAAWAAGKPGKDALAIAAAIATLIALALTGPSLGWHSALLACALAAIAGLYVARLAGRHLGGQTGDIGGAAQQLAEITFLAALLLRNPLG